MEGLGTLANIVGIGSTGAGLFGNIMNAITRGKATSALEGYEKLTPQQLAEKVRGATAPLDQAMVEAIQNQVQADVGSRGLAQAPGVFAAEESQALAPAEQANIDRAIQLIFRQMGIPSEILASTTGSSDPMLALMMLMLRNQSGAGGGSSGEADPSVFTGPPYTPPDVGTPDFPSTQPGGG